MVKPYSHLTAFLLNCTFLPATFLPGLRSPLLRVWGGLKPGGVPAKERQCCGPMKWGGAQGVDEE